MKVLTNKLERVFNAITFTEVGEFEIARQIMNEIEEVKISENICFNCDRKFDRQ